MLTFEGDSYLGVDSIVNKLSVSEERERDWLHCVTGMEKEVEFVSIS